MEEKNNPYIQIDCADKLIQDGGLKHWSASKNKWDPKTTH